MPIDLETLDAALAALADFVRRNLPDARLREFDRNDEFPGGAGVLATFLGSEPISIGGTETQKQQWLGRIAAQGILMAFGATEPAAGSDLASLRTVAERVESGGVVTGYHITGSTAQLPGDEDHVGHHRTRYRHRGHRLHPSGCA